MKIISNGMFIKQRLGLIPKGITRTMNQWINKLQTTIYSAKQPRDQTSPGTLSLQVVGERNW